MANQYFSMHFKLYVCKIIAISAYPSRLFQLSQGFICLPNSFYGNVYDICKYSLGIICLPNSFYGNVHGNVNIYLLVSIRHKQNSDTDRSF